jgi:hypothetical protein
MKGKTLALAILLLAPLAVRAQGGPPAGCDTPGTSHFSVNGSAVGFVGANTSNPATIAGGSVALTCRFALGYEQVIVPALDASYYLGLVEYTMPLRALVGKKINSKFVFNSSAWTTTFFGGVGALRQTLTTTSTDPTTGLTTSSSSTAQHIATTLGAGLNYVANNHVTIQVISAQWIHSPVAGPAANPIVVTPDTSTISTGLRISF